MEERRRFVRLETRVDVTYIVLPSGRAQQTASKDISGEGSCFLTEKPLTPGTSLQVALKLPGREHPVNFTGEVVWSQPYEVIGKTDRQHAVETGVRFAEIAPQDQEAVMQHVTLTLQPHRAS
jgi:c-di-GMP-binding flagellar brake protein YcgR